MYLFSRWLATGWESQQKAVGRADRKEAEAQTSNNALSLSLGCQKGQDNCLSFLDERIHSSDNQACLL